MGWYFVPEEWKMSEDLLAWTKAQGVTDKTIEKEIESFRDHQYKKPMMRADACWRNWVKSGIRFGTIVPIQEVRHNMPKEELPEERERAILSHIADMEKYRSKRK